MNRYTAAGVLADMRAGRRVLVIGENRHHARHAFAEIAASAAPGERVRRTNGEERILAEHGPGRVEFGSRRSIPRGVTYDTVLFDSLGQSMDEVRAAFALVAASAQGEVIRP